MRVLAGLVAVGVVTSAMQAQEVGVNPYVGLMQKAAAHAKAHGAKVAPVLSPVDATVLPGGSEATKVPVAALQAMGVKVVPWTTNDVSKMRELMELRVDGIISDRPDLLRQVVDEELKAATSAAEIAYFKRLDRTAHRGGRGLRPENTLPSFESGLDQLATTLETDTGVTTDGVSLIWHDQFLNPQSCRRADGKPYTLENRAYTKDMSLAEAQSTYICDKLHFHTVPADDVQQNDLSLSPVAVAFAAREKMPSPYAPTYAAQLFRFVKFYEAYYRSGTGKGQPQAKERAENAGRARFNLETKILPPMTGPRDPRMPTEMYENHTVGPQAFVKALCGAIVAEKMEARAEVQSFDFRTLVLVEEQFPQIPTYYLTQSAKVLGTEFTPEALRQK